MAKKLYVGGLAWATTDESLKAAFAQCGNVVSAQVIVDKFSGRSKGFGFVEMETDEKPTKQSKPGTTRNSDGRKIKVNAKHAQRKTCLAVVLVAVAEDSAAVAENILTKAGGKKINSYQSCLKQL